MNSESSHPMRVCADCGRPMYRRRFCRWCYGIRAVVVPGNPIRESSLLDHLLATDDYSGESDADGARRESSFPDGQLV